MESYIVYMHVNKIDGKKYVGITCYQNPERRWINGKGYFRNQYFSRAINKYGWNNFEHTIVARGLSRDEACSIERMMIQSLQTQDRRFGYNITDGGEHFNHSEESKLLMSQNRKGKGLHEFSEDHKRKIALHHGGGAEPKKVICIETGVIYKSINDASRSIGKSKKLISNVCRGVPHFNTAGGYHWKFAED